MLKRELGLQVELVEGRYGEFTVLVDDQPIVRGGALTFLGVMPSLRKVREVLRRALDSSETAVQSGLH
jgi:hypothetical protein